MTDKEKFDELLEKVEFASSKPLYLVAYTDYEEQKFQEWFPGIEILRLPQKIVPIKPGF